MKYEIIIYSSLLYNAALIIFLLFLKAFWEWKVIWEDWEKSLNSIVETMLIWYLLNSQHSTQCLTQYSSYGWCTTGSIMYEQPLHFHIINARRVSSLWTLYFYEKHLVLWNRKSIIITWINSKLWQYGMAIFNLDSPSHTRSSHYLAGFLIFWSLTKFYLYFVFNGSHESLCQLGYNLQSSVVCISLETLIGYKLKVTGGDNVIYSSKGLPIKYAFICHTIFVY